MSLAATQQPEGLRPQPQSFRRRKRPRGESFGSCLLMIIIVLGGGMWAYFKFGENRSLVHAGEEGSYTRFKKGEDYGQSDLNYARKMRESHLPNTGHCRQDVAEFVNKVLQGKYKTDKEGFEQKQHELVQSLRDNLGEINQHTVSPWFEPAHKPLTHSYGVLYNSLLACEKGFYKEGTEQTQLYKEARDYLNKGWRESTAAEERMKVLMSTRTF